MRIGALPLQAACGGGRCGRADRGLPMLRVVAKERQKQAGGDRKSECYQESVPLNEEEAIPKREESAETAAKMVGVGRDSVRWSGGRTASLLISCHSLGGGGLSRISRGDFTRWPWSIKKPGAPQIDRNAPGPMEF